MNRRMKRTAFYLVMIVQVLWWIKVVFTENTQEIRRQSETETQRGDTDDVQQSPMNEYVNHFDTLKFHIQKVQESFSFPPAEGLESETNMNPEEIHKTYFNPFLRHTILPRNSSIVTEGSYLKNPNNLCAKHQDLDLLIIVHTAPYHFSRRAIIRQTMAKNALFPPYTVQPAFFLGVMPDAKKDPDNEARLEKEFQDHGDLIQMDFNEDFRNLSLKAVLWLRWTNEHCHNANMVLKIDDDVVIDMYKVVPLSRGLFSKYKRSIFCYVNRMGTQPIPRIGRTKVDMREFMNITAYPYTYCSGFIVFISPDLIPLLANTIHRVPFYNVDDVFMFGMIPKFTGHVTYHNLGYNVSIWHQKVYNCTMSRGKECNYFGTMAEEDEDRDKVWQAMRNGHLKDFHFSQLRVS